MIAYSFPRGPRTSDRGFPRGPGRVRPDSGAIRDTLLRLAEHPRLYVPRWSETIIAEVVRNLEGRFGLPAEKAAYLVAQLREHFGDSWVTGYEPLIDRMTNDPGDRHVLAAAVKCGAR